MEPGICRNLLTPLAFYVKTRAFEVLGIIRHKLDFGGIYRNDFFQVGQEYCAAVFYKGRNTNTMQTLLVKVVSLNLVESLCACVSVVSSVVFNELHKCILCSFTLTQLSHFFYNQQRGEHMSEKKPMSEARKRANKKWNDENMAKKYDRIQLVVPKGRKSDIEGYAKSKGESVNGLMNALLCDALGMSDEDWKRTDNPQQGDA